MDYPTLADLNRYLKDVSARFHQIEGREIEAEPLAQHPTNRT